MFAELELFNHIFFVDFVLIFSPVDSTDVFGQMLSVLAVSTCIRGLHKTFRTHCAAGPALRPATLQRALGVATGAPGARRPGTAQCACQQWMVLVHALVHTYSLEIGLTLART